MTPPPGTPSDWVSGERVFAPPRGTVDVDWLVPAVLELVPGATAPRARAALADAWARRRAAGDPPGASTTTPATTPATATAPATVPTTVTAPGPDGDDADLSGAAERVLTEALLTFGD